MDNKTNKKELSMEELEIICGGSENVDLIELAKIAIQILTQK